MKITLPVAACFLAILAPSAYAQSAGIGQSASLAMGRVDIPFNFLIAKKEMPAGKFEVMRVQGQESRLQIRNMKTKNTFYIPVLEKLAETDPSQSHGARIVFDTVGGQKILSEFWPANNADGYLLAINKGEQKHEVVEEK